MAQLKMFRVKGTPFTDPGVPEGYSLSTYKDESDKMAWVRCCQKGLVGDDADENTFDDRITFHDDINMATDVIFLDHNGEHVGTITAIRHPRENVGEIHMVGIREDYRGRGLGKYLNAAGVKTLIADGVDYMELTTDEWRRSAVKSYLDAGFLPVEYDTGMRERWEAVLTSHSIPGPVEMIREDLSHFCDLYAKPKTKIGVVGAGRGRTMIDYCLHAQNAELVAICDNHIPTLEKAKKDFGAENITYYSDYDEFLKHDLDAVVLANFANEHAPFAIKALRAGKHVLSELLPAQNLKECVELIEAVEESGKIYAYAENCCFMPAPKKMKKLYAKGAIGGFEYGEGEYMHNCESGWHFHTRGLPDHWRNTMSAFYYCTHATGPLFHITGLKPVKVVGVELPHNARMGRMGAKAGFAGVEIITLENGAAVKCIQGVGPARDSRWFSLYGSKGRMECAREDADAGDVSTLYLSADSFEGENSEAKAVKVDTADRLTAQAEKYPHGGSDYYVMFNFVSRIRGDESADIIDVYEAMDMFLPGLFAYRSVLRGGVPVEIPDLRDKEEREKWRNDTECTDPKAAGDMLAPSYSKGDPGIPDEVYKALREKLAEALKGEK